MFCTHRKAASCLSVSAPVSFCNKQRTAYNIEGWLGGSDSATSVPVNRQRRAITVLSPSTGRKAKCSEKFPGTHAHTNTYFSQTALSQACSTRTNAFDLRSPASGKFGSECNMPALCLEDVRFESRHEHRLYWLKILVFFLSTSREVLGLYLSPTPLPCTSLAIHHSSIMWSLYARYSTALTRHTIYHKYHIMLLSLGIVSVNWDRKFLQILVALYQSTR